MNLYFDEIKLFLNQFGIIWVFGTSQSVNSYLVNSAILCFYNYGYPSKIVL